MLASEKLRDVVGEGLVVDIDIVLACEIRRLDSCSQWVRLTLTMTAWNKF